MILDLAVLSSQLPQGDMPAFVYVRLIPSLGGNYKDGRILVSLRFNASNGVYSLLGLRLWT